MQPSRHVILVPLLAPLASTAAVQQPKSVSTEERAVLDLEDAWAKPFEHRYRFTDTWLQRNGQWQIIAAQDYLVPAGRR